MPVEKIDENLFFGPNTRPLERSLFLRLVRRSVGVSDRGNDIISRCG